MMNETQVKEMLIGGKVKVLGMVLEKGNAVQELTLKATVLMETETVIVKTYPVGAEHEIVVYGKSETKQTEREATVLERLNVKATGEGVYKQFENLVALVTQVVVKYSVGKGLNVVNSKEVGEFIYYLLQQEGLNKGNHFYLENRKSDTVFVELAEKTVGEEEIIKGVEYQETRKLCMYEYNLDKEELEIEALNKYTNLEDFTTIFNGYMAVLGK